MASAGFTENGLPVGLLVFLWCLSSGAKGQELAVGGIPSAADPACLADTGLYAVNYRIIHGFDYALSGNLLYFMNWRQGDPANTIALLHRFLYRWEIEKQGSVTLTGSFLHDLGVQWLPDSLTRFSPDENTLENRVAVTLAPNLAFEAESRMTTPLFNDYGGRGFSCDTRERDLTAAFMTPFTCTVSAGLAWTLPRFGQISAGISSAKFTWVMNRGVFRDLSSFQGVEQAKGFAFEYGISLHLAIDREFAGRFRWNCDLQIFRNYRKPADLAMKNIITLRITGFLHATLQSRVVYERDTDRHLQSESLISLRFCVGL